MLSEAPAADVDAEMVSIHKQVAQFALAVILDGLHARLPSDVRRETDQLLVEGLPDRHERGAQFRGVKFEWNLCRRRQRSREVNEALTGLGGPVERPLHLGGLARTLFEDQAGQAGRRVGL